MRYCSGAHCVTPIFSSCLATRVLCTHTSSHESLVDIPYRLKVVWFWLKLPTAIHPPPQRESSPVDALENGSVVGAVERAVVEKP